MGQEFQNVMLVAPTYSKEGLNGVVAFTVNGSNFGFFTANG